MRNKQANPLPRRKQLEWLLLIVAFALVGAFFSLSHVFEVDRVNATERERLQVLVKMIANDIQSDLTTTNLALEGVIQDYFAGPGAVGSSQDLSRRLRALRVAISGIRTLLVLDARGVVTAASIPALIGTNLSNWDYFKTVRDKPNKATLYVSAPFQSLKREKDLVVTASRMVPGPGGEFAGLVVATLDRDYFTGIFGPVVYAPDVWAFVVHGDGRQFLNYPEKPGIDGTDLNQPGTFFNRYRQSGQIAGVLTGTVYTTGEQRMMALRTIQPAGMDTAIVIGLSRDLGAIAQPLQRQGNTYGLFYAIMALFCASGLYWVQTRRSHIEALNAERERDRLEADDRMIINLGLRESETRFRTLIEDAPLAIAILRAGHFVYSNPRYCALHDYADADELKGLPWSAMISAESRAVLHTQEELIIEDSPIEQSFEAQGVGKEGRLVPVFKTTTRVMLVDGPATLVLAQDISAQKRAELAMLQARDTAEAANRSKAEFLANMSHEIRSPLNAILGLAYLLEQAHLDLDAHNMVGKIRASGRTLLSIINDILDMSKIEAGHMVIEQAPFRLGDVIDNIGSAMSIAAGDKDVELIIQPLPVGVSDVMGDALRLQQVLINLTSNAIKFTHAGRVELRTTLVSRSEENILLRFCVQDTGIGIAPELQGDVFSAFTQADTSTTRRFGGTGLGLAICRQLVSLMGGEIGLTSSPGQGSEFWFTLPLQQIASTDFSSPEMVRIDVLIADDSDIALKAVGATAHRLGWQVSAVDSGEAVLAHLLERKGGKLPSVVVLDWEMPGMDGLATARAIRDGLPGEECPIVIMATAYSLSSLASQPGAEIVDAILTKPVTASTLYNAVIEARRRRAATVGILHVSKEVTSQGLTGVRVLIVDDSEINREVAQRILREQGAIVALAVDGQTALDWLQLHPNDVDLVLMDVQMPVMDGIEATRQLRRMPQFTDLPIVALTAGAFKSQQEAAQAAGMTYFISKPFDVPSTIALIQRLKRRSTTAFAGEHSSAAMPTIAYADLPTPSDLSVMDVARGLQIWSDVGAYRDYLRRFVDSYGNAANVMDATLAAGDRPAAAALAHKLAGVAANLALPDTHRLAGEVEQVLATGDDPTLGLSRLGHALGQVLAAIERFAPPVVTHDSPSSPELAKGDMSPGTQATLKILLIELLAALDTDNPAPVEPILAKLVKLLPLLELTGIWACVRGFDFRGAEVSTLKLAKQYDITLKE